MINKLPILFSLVFNILFGVTTNSQITNACADSSIRIKYKSSNFSLFKPVSDVIHGINYFPGGYSINSTLSSNSGILAKTNWSDSIYFAKRYYSNTFGFGFNRAYITSDNGILLSGESIWPQATGRDFVLVKTTVNGNLIWAKKLKLNFPYSYVADGGSAHGIFFSGDAMYISLYGSNSQLVFNLLAKFDFDGNLLWSTNINLNFPYSQGYILNPMIAPLLKNDTLFSVMHKQYYNTATNQFDTFSCIITKLNAGTGSIIEGTEFFFKEDSQQAGAYITSANINQDGLLLLSGIGNHYTNASNPIEQPFSFLLDNNLLPVSLSFLKPNTPNNLLRLIDNGINNNLHNAYLYKDYSSTTETRNYFIITDSINQIIKTRRFFIPVLVANGTLKEIRLDDKDGIHFLYQYNENNNAVTEYARISDLNPNSTLACFGKDTSLFTRQELTVTQRPFTWPVVQQGLLLSLPVSLIEEDIPLQKEVVCWQVSRCDSINITGPDTVCASAPSVRYSIYKNPECLKKITWHIDTASVSLLATEADSAITVAFKKTGLHIIKAAVDNCVVNDSLLINVSGPLPSVQIIGDSILCPGKTSELQATAGYKNYRWQDGSVLSSYFSSSAGWHTVTAEDYCGHFSVDSFYISPADTSLHIPGVAPLCLTDTVYFTLPASATHITWQPSAFAAVRNNKMLFYPPQTTSYTIEAMVPPDCAVTKHISISVTTCPETVFVPSSFTPNNDGLNDSFKPIVSLPPAQYHFSVYERNGQRVFESHDPLKAWDGTLNGSKQNAGLFVWQLTYQFRNKEVKYAKGTVMLVR